MTISEDEAFRMSYAGTPRRCHLAVPVVEADLAMWESDGSKREAMARLIVRDLIIMGFLSGEIADLIPLG